MKSLTSRIHSMRGLARNSARLLKMGWKEHPFLMLSLVLVSIAASVLPFAQSAVIAVLINNLMSGSSEALILYATFLLILIAVLPEFLSHVYSYLDKRTWIRVINHLEIIFAKKRGELDVKDLENPSFQDTVQRAQENFYAAINMLSSQFDTLRNIVSVIVASVILLTFSPFVLVIIIIGSIPSFLVESRYGAGEWTIWAGKSQDKRRFSDLRWRFSRLEEIIELKIFRNVFVFLTRMKNLLDAFADEQIRNENKRLFGYTFASLATFFAVGYSIFWTVSQVPIGALEIGTMTFVLYAITNFSNSLSAFLNTFARQFSYSLHVNDLFTVLDRDTSVGKSVQYESLKDTGTPKIVFENVTFSYPDTTKEVLKNFSLTIEPNERLAIVGVNGAGKTTLVKLIAGFYNPTSGRILIDGVDLRNIDVDVWYKKLAILFQDYAIYNFPVREGIALGNSESLEDFVRIQSSAEASDAHSFIEEWQKKYDQMIGKEFTDGVEPSKGQAQKLALARSFYRAPRVLILDEPTSSVDAEAEAKIFEQIEKLPREQTMILISHRFSTVRNADKICVIEDGRISEYGTHEELLAHGGTYKRLFEKQAKGYK